MKVGVVFPQTEIGVDPGGVREFAQAVQELGYDHLLAYDHVLGADVSDRADWAGPYTSEHQFHELFVLFGYLAAIVPGLELVAGVLVLPQRQTALVAKQAAEIDILTGGNFRLGVGLGWNFVEFEALGENFHDRGQALGGADRGDAPALDRAGRRLRRPLAPHPAGRDQPAPRPAADPDLDRRLRGGGPPAHRSPGGRVLPAAADRRRLAEDVRALPGLGRGRPAATPSRSGIEWRIDVSSGTPDDWRAEVEERKQLGATHFSLATMRGGLDVNGHIARIQEAREALA